MQYHVGTDNTDEYNKVDTNKSNTDDENIYTSEEDDENYQNGSRDAYVTLKMDNQSDNNIKPYPKYGYVGDNNESTINRAVHQKSQSLNPNHKVITKPRTTRSQLIVGHLGISEKTELHRSLHLHQVLPSHYKKRIKSQLIVKRLGISEKTELHRSLHLHRVLPSHYNTRVKVRARRYLKNWILSHKTTLEFPNQKQHKDDETDNCKIKNPDSREVALSVVMNDRRQPNNKQLIITGSIFGHDTEFLVDTGAVKTIIQKNYLKKISQGHEPHISPANSINRLKAANGTTIDVCGMVRLPMYINQRVYTYPVHVVADITYDVILGKDFLTDFGGIINFKDDKITLTYDGEPPRLTEPTLEEEESCDKKQCTDDQQLYATKGIHINSRMEIICSQPYTFHGPNGTYIFEPNLDLQDELQVTIEPTIINSEHHNVIFKVINPGNEAKQIQRNALLGTMKLIPNDVEISPINLVDNEDLPKGDKYSFNISVNLSSTEKEALLQLLHEFRDIFSTASLDVGRTNLAKHQIDTNQAPPIRKPPYRVSPQQRQEIDDQLQYMLDKNIIKPSTSPWASPVILVPKSDGTKRMCIDFRAINKITTKDSHPLPRIDDTLDALHGAKYFTTLDMLSGYWQVELTEDAKPKTAFITHNGLYQCEVMPFGLCNAPGTFQRLMTYVLSDLLWKCALIYIDDIIVYSTSFSQHLIDLRKVFVKIRKANLSLKTSKCTFAKASTNFLGHVVTTEGVKPNEENLKAVKEFATPQNRKNVQSFLGLTGYYRRFIKDYAKIANPLFNLTHQGTPFIWNESHERAFRKLQQILLQHPVMAYPNFKKQFMLITDASQTGIGYTLCQEDDFGRERVILYGSKQLSHTEQKGSATEREALAIVTAIKKCHAYIHGQKFLLVTDHQPLHWLFNAKEPTGKLSRWAMTLQSYDFDVQYRPGKLNSAADALSRLPITKSLSEFVNPKPSHTTNNQEINKSEIASINQQIKELPTSHSEILQLQQADTEMLHKINYLKNNTLPADKKDAMVMLADISNYYLDQNGLLHHVFQPGKVTAEGIYKQLVLPEKYRADIVFWNHDHPMGGHFGYVKTLERIRRNYFWPLMATDIYNWVLTCVHCAQKKGSPGRNKAPLLPIPATIPWQEIACDVIGPLPPTLAGNRYVVVFMDRATSWPEAFATATIDSPIIADLILNNIVFRYGTPQRFLTDRGTNFLSKIIQHLCTMINTKKINTTPYHPQCDGMVERYNGTLIKSLSHYVASHQKDWDLHLAAALFAYRSVVNKSRGESPYYLLFGRHPRLPCDATLEESSDVPPTIQDYINRMKTSLELAHELAHNNLQKAQLQQKFQYDKTAKEPQFQVDDLVWLHNPKRKKGLSPKLQSPWIGPYRIEVQTSPVNYRIVEMHNEKKSLLVHANRLKKYHNPNKCRLSGFDMQPTEDNSTRHLETTSDNIEENAPENIHITQTESTDITPEEKLPITPTSNDDNLASAMGSNASTNLNPDTVLLNAGDEPNIYEVEEIENTRMRKKKREFLVKWKGYDKSENTWEPEENLNPVLVQKLPENN